MPFKSTETYLHRWVTDFVIDELQKVDGLIPRIGYVVVIIEARCSLRRCNLMNLPFSQCLSSAVPFAYLIHCILLVRQPIQPLYKPICQFTLDGSVRRYN